MSTARFTFHRLRRFADLPILAVAALWVLTSPAAADTFTETYYFVTGGIAVSDIEGNGFKDRSPGPDLLPYTDDDEDTPENGNSGGTWTFATLDNDGDGAADRIFSCTRRFDDDTYTLTSYSDFERGVIAEGEDWIDLHEALGRGPSADGTLGVDTGDDFEWNDRPNWEGQSNWFWYNNLSANQRGWGGSRYYFEHRNDGKFYEVQGWKKLVNLQTNGDDPRTPGFNEKHREYARGDGAVIKGLLIPVSAIASLKDGELDALFGWYKKDMAAYVRDVLGPKLQDESLSAFVQDEDGGPITESGNACGATRALLPPTWLMIEQGEWNVQLFSEKTPDYALLAGYWGIQPKAEGSLETNSVLRWSRIMVKGDDLSYQDEDGSWNPPIDLTPADGSRKNLWRNEKFVRGSVKDYDPFTMTGTGLPDSWGALALGCGIPVPDEDNTPPDACWYFLLPNDTEGIPVLEDCQKDWELTLPGGSGPDSSWFELPLTHALDASKAPVRGEVRLRLQDPAAQNNRIHVILTSHAGGPAPVAWANLKDGGIATAGVGGGFNRNTGPVAGGKEIDDRASVALSSTEGKYSHVEIVFDARKKNLTVNLDGQKLVSGNYTDFEGATVNGIRIWTESGAGEENRIYVDDVAVLQDIPLAFIRGEINCDGQGDLSDAVASLNYQFLAGNPPCCLAAADVNGDGSLDLTDAVFWLNFSFLGGGAPADPYPHCAVDWETNLACGRFPGCQ